ncbi:NAD(P)-dependent dehydrogenase (short-subunit alcohol dehydrogenase family) [Angulomicrobium tetraedrale]|uniref:NAD(P)-dependent dehydrogenase (Short-subunit alcohol dehydrogenase family) n=1 Tax=Ancylobacter tetraedralis TaxID=217068 RepID=A0A839ZFK1_9HYPH|nr:SDR family oxidoreductase [Ancylobacter tetraedralis]MBB3773416.1 NAD(P)-dependent dehydrogenase (short-subunit alcohol dehydrogenase family) [Ancylobacter tetraedralis]
MDMSGKVVLITGGETGIGRATVELLAASGARVVVGGLLEDEGAAMMTAVSVAGGLAEFHKVDVRSSAEVDAFVDAAASAYGKIDGFVNNAAVFDGFVTCLETTDALWNHVLDVNLRGTFFGCRAALRHMVPTGAGRIVNVSSVGGLVGAADGPSYTASKHAVIGLTKQIACAYAAQGIAVNAVCPGVIATEIRKNSTRLLGDDAPKMAGVGVDTDWLPRTVPMGRKAAPSEIATVIRFLLSDEASYVTGQYFTADGGWTAK